MAVMHKTVVFLPPIRLKKKKKKKTTSNFFKRTRCSRLLAQSPVLWLPQYSFKMWALWVLSNVHLERPRFGTATNLPFYFRALVFIFVCHIFVLPYLSQMETQWAKLSFLWKLLLLFVSWWEIIEYKLHKHSLCTNSSKNTLHPFISFYSTVRGQKTVKYS